ncbi:MAG: hypothetical protein J3Q66DRAFT_337212 [Benniella sp.]|nr:MAG: hypothetical protein J3Q66DRAFT_337212 [Benniella sp.]
MLTTLPPKLRAWFASLTSPSATHASGMLILLGILVAVTEANSAQVQDESIHMHHPKVSRSPSQPGDEDTEGLSGAEVEPMSNQEMLKYVAMGMVVSQTLIRLLQYISNRRDAAAARKRDEDSQAAPRRSKRAGGLTFNALEGLDEEEQKKRRAEHLAALGDKADLLPSDSDDDDYEESDSGSSESDDESEGVDSEVEEERMDETMGNDNEGEPRRRVLYAGEEIEG